MTENRILVRFEGKGDKRLIAAIEKLAKAQERLTRATKQSEVVLDKNGKALRRNTQRLGGMANALATVRSKLLVFNFAMAMGVRQMIQMVQHSAKVDAMRMSFSNLADSANLGFNTLEKLRGATNNTASDFDLLAQANNALLLGVVDNSDQMAEMFDVAQRLGRALGRDTKSSVESLITGIGRQSRLMLDNLGIVVKTDEAYKEYAKKLKISADNLTDAQRKQAFLNATMEAAQDKVKNLGEEQLTATDHFGAFNTAISNAMDVIGKKLAPTFALAAKEYGEFIADVIGSNPEIVKYTSEIEAMDRELVKLKSDSELLTEVVDKQSTTYKDYFDNVKKLNPELKNSGEVEEMLNAQIKTLNKQIELLTAHIKKEKEAYLNSLGVKKETTEATVVLTKELAKQAELELQMAHLQDGIVTFEEQRALSKLQLKNAKELENLGLISGNELLAIELRLKQKGIALDKEQANEKMKLAAKTVGALADMNDAFKGSTLASIRMRQVQAGIDAYASFNMQLVESKLPYPLNVLSASLSLAAGLANIRKMSSAAGDKFEQGGLVGGRRHSQGGTIIEAEQGEYVMSRNAVDAIGLETMNRINAGGGAGGVNISFTGNVMSQDFIENEAIPQIKEAIRRGADIGVS